MVFLSGYENDLYNDYLTHTKGWYKRRIKTTTRGHNGKDFEREEIVWYNQNYCDALQSGRVPVRLSAKERRYKKVNPERVIRTDDLLPKLLPGEIRVDAEANP
ncbi:MAG: hypothetical protein ABIJ53_01825 [Verrucomicrobiota bacterium]